MTKNAAVLYASHGIRTNAIAPGGVATNIDGTMKSDFTATQMGPFFQSLRFESASARALATSITWLLSSDSEKVNGGILPSDGGWAAQ